MPKYLTILTGIGIAYFALGLVGLAMPAVGTSVALFWLPTGIAVATLFRFGYRYWPAVCIASVAVNLVIGSHWLTCIGIGVGNMLAAVASVAMLHGMKLSRRFDRQQDIVLLAIASHLGMLISASTGVASLVFSNAITENYSIAWLCWWAGDSMGVIAAAPLLLVASRSEFRAIQKRLLEFVGWLSLTALITYSIFITNQSNRDGPALALAFLPFPLIAWAALRFETIGTSLAIMLISFGAAYGTSTQTGPFYRVDVTPQVLSLWIYMVTMATLGWMIVALHSAQVKAVNVQRVLEIGLREASMGVLLTDSNRLITYVNEGFTQLTGYGPTEVVGKNCNCLQGENTDFKTIDQIRMSLLERSDFDGEIINYRKNGTNFWNGLLISPLFDDAGGNAGFIGIQRDITAKKEIEFALKRSEARLRTILDLEPECVMILSPSGEIVEINPAGLRIIECDALEQAKGIRWESLVAEENKEAYREMHLQVLAGESRQIEFRIFGLQGTEQWLESNAVGYRDEHGVIVGQLAVIRDVTQRKRSEDDLKASEHRYRDLFKNNPQPMWVYDLESLKFLAVNNAAVEHYGYSRDEFLAMTIKDIRPPDDVPNLLRNVAQVSSGLDRAGTWRHFTKGGKLIQVEIVSHVMPFFDRRAELVLANDVTERKQLEEQVQATQQRFQAIVERSHDLILILDRDGKIMFANPASREILGYEPEEMIGQYNLDFVGKQDHERTRRELEEIVSNSQMEFRSEIRALHKKGHWKTLEAVGVNLLEVPSLGGIVVNCRDITERKEREIRTANELSFFEMLSAGTALPQTLNQIASNCELLGSGLKCIYIPLDDSGEVVEHETLPVACVPIVSSKGLPLGKLVMHCSEPRTLSTTEVALVDQAANFCVLAIERNALLESIRDSEVRLKTLVGNLPGMAYRCQNDANWTMSFVSSGCVFVTGYQHDELEQNKSVTYADLVHPLDRDLRWTRCQESINSRVLCNNTYRITDKAGQIRWVSERASAVYADDGSVRCIDGFIQDITDARRVEEQILASLSEKDAMLKEIHHRVKNNLQIVCSLLNLQVGNVQDRMVLNVLQESQNRIRSMALVHETLYMSSNLGTIDLCKYVVALCGNLFRSYGIDNSQVRLQLNVTRTSLDLERAIPFGLIINELVSNALKYAFPAGRTGMVVVTFNTKSEEHFFLSVSDDGIGLPASFELNQLRSLGLQIVQDLIQQLSGTLSILQSHGTEFCVSFPIRSTN